MVSQKDSKPNARAAVLRITGISYAPTAPKPTSEERSTVSEKKLPSKTTKARATDLQESWYDQQQVADRRKRLEGHKTSNSKSEVEFAIYKTKDVLSLDTKPVHKSKRKPRMRKKKDKNDAPTERLYPLPDSNHSLHGADSQSRAAKKASVTKLSRKAAKNVGGRHCSAKPETVQRDLSTTNSGEGTKHEEHNNAKNSQSHELGEVGPQVIFRDGIWQTVPKGAFKTQPLRVVDLSAQEDTPTRYLYDSMLLYANIPIQYPQQPGSRHPLVEIRLVTILPAFMGESIICTMFTTNIKQANNKFIALSYAWGSIDKPHCISVRGYRLYVTRSLYKALLQLRRPYETVTVWADAICIDQNNTQERNFQVKQMPKIYRAAAEVVSWIGDGTDQTDRVMDLIKSDQSDRRIDLTQATDDVISFFSREYWHRVWVVQEIAAVTLTGRPCSLRCGTKTITLNKLRVFLRKFRINWNKHGIHLSPRALLSLSTQDRNRTFLQVLQEASQLQARDDRDRIYGIRGISPKVYRDSVEVDYTISFEKLSERVLTEIVNKDRSLDALCLFKSFVRNKTSKHYLLHPQETYSNSTQDKQPPTWLRDFREVHPGIAPETFSACNGRRSIAGVRNQILFARGINIDAIAERHLFVELSDEDHSHYISSMKEINKIYSEEPIQTRVNRLGHLESAGELGVASLANPSVTQRWKTAWLPKFKVEEDEVLWNLWSHYARYLRRFSPELFDRCCFLTREGRIGLGPRGMAVGDAVVVLFGCQMPVVLRKDGRYYEFIGPVYLEGAMCGEPLGETCNNGERFRIL